MKFEILHQDRSHGLDELLITRIISEATQETSFEKVVERMTEIVEQENDNILATNGTRYGHEMNDFFMVVDPTDQQIRIMHGYDAKEEILIIALTDK